MLDELPVSLVMTRRPAAGDESADALDRISSHPRVQVESLLPLGIQAVEELAPGALGDRAEPGGRRGVHRGDERQPVLRPRAASRARRGADLRGAELKRRARALAPDAVTRSLRVRVGRLGPAAASLARAVAILGDLGAALRRENRRADAREPLELAADMAARGGAVALPSARAIELAATGARPRRDALLSGPGSLTPSERRIAELAATGQSNREIAQALFVTPKTVEYHLRNAYRKLDIQTRRDLAEALA